jgi:hypothetical protein
MKSYLTSIFLFIAVIMAQNAYAQSPASVQQLVKKGEIVDTWIPMSSTLKKHIRLQLWKFKNAYFTMRIRRYKSYTTIIIEHVHLKVEKADTIVTVDRRMKSGVRLHMEFIIKNDLWQPYANGHILKGWIIFYKAPVHYLYLE